jgi:hypothetical protein
MGLSVIRFYGTSTKGFATSANTHDHDTDTRVDGFKANCTQSARYNNCRWKYPHNRTPNCAKRGHDIVTAKNTNDNIAKNDNTANSIQPRCVPKILAFGGRDLDHDDSHGGGLLSKLRDR